jgi:uncharacterized protein (TIGR03435 family)
MHRMTLVAVCAAALFVRCLAQAPADLAFEVVSVKAHPPGGSNAATRQIQPGGRYVAANTPLTVLITQAYLIQPYQLQGAPAWAAERFDISARAPQGVELTAPSSDPSAPRPMELMMRAMLADRFQLKVHIEPRETAAYDLVLARSDGRPGPKLTPSTTDCAAEAAAARARGDVPTIAPYGQPLKCGTRLGPGTMTAGAISMKGLAATIAQRVGRPVADRTGLVGTFDLDLTFTPPQLPARARGTPADAPVQVNGLSIDPNGPSYLTALQEQLGLKVEATRTMVDMLVIDRLEKPTED